MGSLLFQTISFQLGRFGCFTQHFNYHHHHLTTFLLFCSESLDPRVSLDSTYWQKQHWHILMIWDPAACYNNWSRNWLRGNSWSSMHPQKSHWATLVWSTFNVTAAVFRTFVQEQQQVKSVYFCLCHTDVTCCCSLETGGSAELISPHTSDKKKLVSLFAVTR